MAVLPPVGRAIDALLSSGDTGFFDALDPGEKAVIRAAIKEYNQGGKSEILSSLWKMDYYERPPTPEEFLSSPDYLGEIGKELYPLWKRDILYVLDPANEVIEWILDGAIGIGKTTKAVVALLYKMCHLFKMKDPQSHFGMMKNSPIVFALFNVYKYLGEDGAYAYLMSFMQGSPYFREIYIKSKEPKGKRAKDAEFQFHAFPNNVGITTGSSAINALGQNIIGGLADEVNFRDQGARRGTDQGSSAFNLYVGVRKRIESRFTAPVLLCLCSSSQDEFDFTEEHKKRQEGDPRTFHSRYSLYEMKEERFRGEERFRVFTGSRTKPPRVLDPEEMVEPKEEHLIEEVPVSLKSTYELNVVEAVRDISGRSVSAVGRLIPDGDYVFGCNSGRQNPFTMETLQIGVRDDTTIQEFFIVEAMFKRLDYRGTKFAPLRYPSAPRFIHIDLAETGCAAGVVCVCPSGSSRVLRYNRDVHDVVSAEEFSYHIDFAIRIRNIQGDRIDFGEIRAFVKWLKSMGLPLRKVTYDRFQSTDSINLLIQAGIDAGVQSVVRTLDPYLTVRNATVEGRMDYVNYNPLLQEMATVKIARVGKGEQVVIGEYGSKDVADSLAGAVFTCATNSNLDDVKNLRTEAVGAMEQLRSDSMVDMERILPPGGGTVPENPWDNKWGG